MPPDGIINMTRFSRAKEWNGSRQVANGRRRNVTLRLTSDFVRLVEDINLTKEKNTVFSPKTSKFFKILRHIEFCGTCIEH